jgi:hypothetical protein
MAASHVGAKTQLYWWVTGGGMLLSAHNPSAGPVAMLANSARPKQAVKQAAPGPSMPTKRSWGKQNLWDQSSHSMSHFRVAVIWTFWVGSVSGTQVCESLLFAGRHLLLGHSSWKHFSWNETFFPLLTFYSSVIKVHRIEGHLGCRLGTCRLGFLFHTGLLDPPCVTCLWGKQA